MDRAQTEEAIKKFYELTRIQKMPSDQAFKIAFPQGLPSIQDLRERTAKRQERAGLSGLAGVLAGSLVNRGIGDYMNDRPLFGGGWLDKVIMGDESRSYNAEKSPSWQVEDSWLDRLGGSLGFDDDSSSSDNDGLFGSIVNAITGLFD